MSEKLHAVGSAPAIKAEKLNKVYPNGTAALTDVNLSIGRDEFVVVIGSSGAGKSTFLRCLNRLVRPTSGSLELFGEDISCVCGGRLRRVRRKVGMIFQQFHLVRRLTVIENVLVGRLRFNASPARHVPSLFGVFPRQEREFAFECLRQVGIADLAFHRADQLSGGQQQRVAIARALAQEPEVFLADEPIASLDPHSAEMVMQNLMRIHEERRIPVLVNLHHIDFAQRFGKRAIGISKGRVVFDDRIEALSDEAISHVYGDRIREAYGETADSELSACA
ncbi:phosphonate ABC transporter, ATPase subunit [Desulfovibrio sp. X2]|uniref:phosphonate ABC transporter ATP-binding protein n=1 Tax=Desulfovibrio sp. X2 TaxID=941449 RepID=UPI000358F33D|nr:phosphonate ABC transporter ATP-binding protein [Desulfovibrio sp. X2]EPR43828.1 phosphonate ABC transporter, ATPase subunit [Desulfovibrio sp. X2]